MKKIIISIIIFLVGFFSFLFFEKRQDENIISREGNVISSDTSTSSIRVENIAPGEKMQSPIFIQGRARGTWFFEASFPIEIRDGNGIVLGRGIAQADGEWMTENFVPFSANLSFERGNATSGEIVFKKDNPSDDPSRDEEFAIPVQF